jgi:hypothetical protein
MRTTHPAALVFSRRCRVARRAALRPLARVSRSCDTAGTHRFGAPRRWDLRVLALLLALAAPAFAAARERLVILPATGSNVPDAVLSAATDVLRAQLERAGFEVERALSPARSGADPSSAEAGAAAHASSASLAVTLRVARLADTFSARLGAYRADGSTAHADELGGRGPDDLDPVLERLALGLARGREARTLAQIHTVTAREVPPLAKQQPNAGVAMRLGMLGARLRPDPLDRHGVASGLGLSFYYDARTYLAEIGLEGYTSDVDPLSDPDRALAIAMNVAMPFGKGNAAPFVGGGAAYTIGTFGGDGGAGLQARVATGLIFGRLTEVPFRFEVGYFWNLYPERELGTRDEVYVHGVTAAIVISTLVH